MTSNLSGPPIKLAKPWKPIPTIFNPGIVEMSLPTVSTIWAGLSVWTAFTTSKNEFVLVAACFPEICIFNKSNSSSCNSSRVRTVVEDFGYKREVIYLSYAGVNLALLVAPSRK